MNEAVPLNDYDRGQNNDHESTPLRTLSVESSKKERIDVAKRPKRAITLDSWLLESIAVAVSMGCFIAIAVVLYIYDGEVRPEIGHGINLNTIVSILATGSKSALVFAVGESIGQLKWLWFQDPTKSESQLVSIQRFDAASRGPSGSAMILYHHRFCSLVSVGAAVIVLLLSFDPFVQQVLTYPVGPTIDSSATSGATAPQLREYITTINDTRDIGIAYTEGFYSQNQDFRVPPICSSGNCTWDQFSSVGICSSCSNISTTAKLKCESASTTAIRKACSITLPGGFGYDFDFVQNQTERFHVDFGSGISRKFTYDTVTFRNPIIWRPFSFNASWINQIALGAVDRQLPEFPNATLAGVKDPQLPAVYIELGLNTSPIQRNASMIDRLFIKNATACSLSTCLRDYEIIVDNGTPSIKTKNIDFGTIYQDITPGGLCWTPGPPDSLGFQEGRNFTFCEPKFDELVSVLKYFPLEQNTQYTWNSNDLGKEIGSYEILREDSSRYAFQLEQLNRNGFEKTVENIAASLTKFGLEGTNQSVDGTVQVTKVFVHVRWPWLILPGCLVVAGTIFLVVTIAVSSKNRAPLWKSSALVPYYHGLEEVDDDHNEYRASSAMDKNAEKMEVQLQRSTTNGRLMMLRWQDDSTSSIQGESSSTTTR
ncbi:unnamed protein product [Penicillium salamii]|uniref:Uncharacterized protein n=1 Tax=Penicillium salamii TaxID=1612424 RepID=A0A9W4J0G3_9EURO|nr:unnamed protein product [Penicillium salamii]CAG8012145.1 unnamed protein product [Penicillium salamii]CAG8020040.1 unnamed protein product [Penicillium salamii]CAG8121649.1 unnamed protein product [Penicillium salamii]CAG8147378.1 unnamed protein product [Penicillium salamii]